jgi:hypothetical protein
MNLEKKGVEQHIWDIGESPQQVHESEAGHTISLAMGGVSRPLLFSFSGCISGVLWIFHRFCGDKSNTDLEFELGL